ncbi:hypothetical protein [Streptomyces sp. enrichment culture]|uniref:hypothetical protein n=1 Tax=Streptomyces sp. enrichment culture TaxID=1795815 RepID=UPI003F574EA1
MDSTPSPCAAEITATVRSFIREDIAPVEYDNAGIAADGRVDRLDPLMDGIAAELITRAPLEAEDIAARGLRGVDARRFLVLPDRARGSRTGRSAWRAPCAPAG